MSFKLPHDARMRRVDGLAFRWAQRFGDAYLGAEHLVLALTEVGGPASDVLARMGVRTENLRDAVLESRPESKRKLFAPADDEVLEDVGWTCPRWKRASRMRSGSSASVRPRCGRHTPALIALMPLAEDHAERLGQSEVRPEHVLLAIVWEDSNLGMRLLSRFLSGQELRRRLLDRMDVAPENRDRYIEECERSERVAAERAAVGARRLAASWWDTSTVDERGEHLLADGGATGVKDVTALEHLLERASSKGYTAIDVAGEKAPSFWVEVNPKLWQVFIAFAAFDAEQASSTVGVSDPSLVPPWVDVSSWPGVQA